jgi:hypothetical protein
MKKKHNNASVKLEFSHDTEAALKALTKMRRLDLQKECLKRGIDFKHVSESTPFLQDFFIRHFEVPINDKLLSEYDKWFENEMLKKGNDRNNPKSAYLFHPALRMDYQGATEETEETEEAREEQLKAKKKAKQIEPKDPKPKREKDENLGVTKGTKKALTFECASKGLDEDKTIKKVLKEFPDANPESIKIWYRRKAKELGIYKKK